MCVCVFVGGVYIQICIYFFMNFKLTQFYESNEHTQIYYIYI